MGERERERERGREGGRKREKTHTLTLLLKNDTHTSHTHLSPSWPKEFSMCVFCIPTTLRWWDHLGHRLNHIHIPACVYDSTCDQIILGYVLFYPMGNTSPLKQLWCVHLLLATWLIIIISGSYNYHSWPVTFNTSTRLFCIGTRKTWENYYIHNCKLHTHRDTHTQILVTSMMTTSHFWLQTQLHLLLNVHTRHIIFVPPTLSSFHTEDILHGDTWHTPQYEHIKIV